MSLNFRQRCVALTKRRHETFYNSDKRPGTPPWEGLFHIFSFSVRFRGHSNRQYASALKTTAQHKKMRDDLCLSHNSPDLLSHSTLSLPYSRSPSPPTNAFSPSPFTPSACGVFSPVQYRLSDRERKKNTEGKE